MRRTIAATVLAATSAIAGLTAIAAISGTALAADSGPDTVSCCRPH